MTRMHDDGMPVALITGGSSGLGRAMAARFRREGYKVVIAGRTRPETLEADDFIAADLSAAGGAAQLAADFRNRCSRLDLLVNNAGIGAYAAWEELGEADLRRLMEIDFFAPAALTGALLGELAAAGGTVVNISSIAGLMPVACMGAYSAAKAAFFMYSESLRIELAGRVQVLTVCPGRIDTGFSRRSIACRECPETPGRTASSPEALAERVARAVRRRRRMVIYPAWYRLPVWFARIFPGLYGRANRRVWKLDGRRA